MYAGYYIKFWFTKNKHDGITTNLVLRQMEKVASVIADCLISLF